MEVKVAQILFKGQWKRVSLYNLFLLQKTLVLSTDKFTTKKQKIPTRWMISTVKVSISYSCFQARQRNSEAEKDTKSYPCFLWCSKLEWADVTERIMTAKTLVLMGIVRWKNRKRKLHKAHIAPDRNTFHEPLPEKLNLAHRTKFFRYSNTWKLSSCVLFSEWTHLLWKNINELKEFSTQTNCCSEQADRLKLTIWQDIQLVKL